jgi:hypothetical protein
VEVNNHQQSALACPENGQKWSKFQFHIRDIDTPLQRRHKNSENVKPPQKHRRRIKTILGQFRDKAARLEKLKHYCLICSSNIDCSFIAFIYRENRYTRKEKCEQKNLTQR